MNIVEMMIMTAVMMVIITVMVARQISNCYSPALIGFFSLRSSNLKKQ